MKALQVVVGATIRSQRELLGITQHELGYLTSLDPMTISRIERGERMPSLQSLFLIAKALGKAPSEIVHMVEGSGPAIELSEDPAKAYLSKKGTKRLRK